MKLSHSVEDGIHVVEVFGEVDTSASNQLYDALVAHVSTGNMKLVVDFSGAAAVTGAGVRDLVVASKLFRTLKGEIRICGAESALGDLLALPGFCNLLAVDHDRKTAVCRLSAVAPCAPVVPATASLLTTLKTRLRQLAA